MTVDTHCKIWQIVENEPSSPLIHKKKSPIHRIHSLDDVLNKDKDFIINYFATTTSTAKTRATNNNKRESSPIVTDEGFHSNESNTEHHATDKSHNNTSSNKKRLLFSSHAQFSRDFSLDDGVEESIVLSEIEPTTVCELLNEDKDGENSASNFQLPSVKNEVYVKICSSGSSTNDVDTNNG